MPTYTNSTTDIIKRTCRDEFGALAEKVFLPGVPVGVLEYFTVSGLTKTSDAPYWNPVTAEPQLVTLAQAGATKNITAITKAVSAQITAVGHGLSTGDYAYIDRAVLGMHEIRDMCVKVTKVDNDKVTLDGVDSRLWAAYTGAGTIRKITPALITISAATDKIKVFGINQNTGCVRVHGQDILNHPHMGDVIDGFDLAISGVRGRWTALSLTEISGEASTSVRVEQQ
jgi:hypothetical protein